MAINSASDDPEGVCEAMLQFEREHGSLETFEVALEKCSAQLKRVRERREIVSCVYSGNVPKVRQNRGKLPTGNPSIRLSTCT